jgi:hypothetical protein
MSPKTSCQLLVLTSIPTAISQEQADHLGYELFGPPDTYSYHQHTRTGRSPGLSTVWSFWHLFLLPSHKNRQITWDVNCLVLLITIPTAISKEPADHLGCQLFGPPDIYSYRHLTRTGRSPGLSTVWSFWHLFLLPSHKNRQITWAVNCLVLLTCIPTAISQEQADHLGCELFGPPDMYSNRHLTRRGRSPGIWTVWSSWQLFLPPSHKNRQITWAVNCLVLLTSIPTAISQEQADHLGCQLFGLPDIYSCCHLTRTGDHLGCQLFGPSDIYSYRHLTRTGRSPGMSTIWSSWHLFLLPSHKNRQITWDVNCLVLLTSIPTAISQEQADHMGCQLFGPRDAYSCCHLTRTGRSAGMSTVWSSWHLFLLPSPADHLGCQLFGPPDIYSYCHLTRTGRSPGMSTVWSPWHLFLPPTHKNRKITWDVNCLVLLTPIPTANSQEQADHLGYQLFGPPDTYSYHQLTRTGRSPGVSTVWSSWHLFLPPTHKNRQITWDMNCLVLLTPIPTTNTQEQADHLGCQLFGPPDTYSYRQLTRTGRSPGMSTVWSSWHLFLPLSHKNISFSMKSPSNLLG